MPIEAKEHPANVKSYELGGMRWAMALAIAGALGFVALGLWLTIAPDTSYVQKAVGALCSAFFAFAAIVGVQRMRRGVPIVLSHEGLAYAFAPYFDKRRLIPWRDIDGFGRWNMYGQEINCVRLASLDALLRQFNESEAGAVVKNYRRLMGFGAASAVVAGANLKFGDADKLAQMVAGSGAVASLAEMLRAMRETWGGEVCLSWADRGGRTAEEFEELLETWRSYCTSPR